jgi:hypothetical protein
MWKYRQPTHVDLVEMHAKSTLNGSAGKSWQRREHAKSRRTYAN